MITTIPEYHTYDKIQSYFQLPMKKIKEVIEFLIEEGLLVKNMNRLQPAWLDLHLEKSSKLISKQHTNWRLQAIRSLDQDEINELHYSLVFTISRSDLAKIRQTLTIAIENCEKKFVLQFLKILLRFVLGGSPADAIIYYSNRLLFYDDSKKWTIIGDRINTELAIAAFCSLEETKAFTSCVTSSPKDF